MSQELMNSLLNNPFHPFKLGIFVACLVLLIIALISYKKDKKRETIGSIGFCSTLALGYLISLLYPKFINRQVMFMIQVIIPIVAVAFYLGFRKKK